MPRTSIGVVRPIFPDASIRARIQHITGTGPAASELAQHRHRFPPAADSCRGLSPCLSSQPDIHSSTGSYGSIPARLGRRTSWRVSSTTESRSARATPGPASAPLTARQPGSFSIPALPPGCLTPPGAPPACHTVGAQRRGASDRPCTQPVKHARQKSWIAGRHWICRSGINSPPLRCWPGRRQWAGAAPRRVQRWAGMAGRAGLGCGAAGRRGGRSGRSPGSAASKHGR